MSKKSEQTFDQILEWADSKENSEKSKKINEPYWIIAGVLISIIILFIFIWVLSSPKSPEILSQMISSNNIIPPM